MFSLFAKKGPTTATINGQAIPVEPKETLLQAALRAGIDFPHSCRVGGCAACKCQLVAGQVEGHVGVDKAAAVHLQRGLGDGVVGLAPGVGCGGGQQQGRQGETRGEGERAGEVQTWHG